MDDDRLDNIKLFKYILQENRNLSPTEKLVAATLMSHRNNVSMMCCPGLTLLVQETGFSRYGIQKIIQSLIKKKAIVRLRITSGKQYLKSQYYFLYDIATARDIYNNEDSIFTNYHVDQVENFEWCMAEKLF